MDIKKKRKGNEQHDEKEIAAKEDTFSVVGSETAGDAVCAFDGYIHARFISPGL